MIQQQAADHSVFSGALIKRTCLILTVLAPVPLSNAVAAPVDYVRICSFTGAGFFYIPGTDKCAYALNFPYVQQTQYGLVSTQSGSAAAAYGTNSFAPGSNSVAIGDHAFSGGDPFSGSPGAGNGIDGVFPASAYTNTNTTAIGQGAQAGASAAGQNNATAVGQGAQANVLNGTAVGQGATVTATSASAFGAGASATAQNSVAIGQNSVADQANTVSVGTVGGERRIVNVAAGTLAADSTDAVNGSQLYATNQMVLATAGDLAAVQNGMGGAFQANNGNAAAAPAPTGANAVAGGFGAVASGSNSTAVGTGARATMAGDSAFGAGAVASGDPATAVGSNATASGNNSVAVGANATAGGTSAVAIGQGSSATQTNTIAVGQGVNTTRANQVLIGNAANTYTLPGIASAASLAAQAGPTQFVTSDANGNLATTNNVATATSVAALDGRVGALEQNVGLLQRDIRRGYEGTALAIALGGGTWLPENKRFAISGNFGTFRGQNAFGGSFQARVTDNLVLNAGIGAGFQQGGVGGRVGASYAW